MFCLMRIFVLPKLHASFAPLSVCAHFCWSLLSWASVFPSSFHGINDGCFPFWDTNKSSFQWSDKRGSLLQIISWCQFFFLPFHERGSVFYLNLPISIKIGLIITLIAYQIEAWTKELKNHLGGVLLCKTVTTNHSIRYLELLWYV